MRKLRAGLIVVAAVALLPFPAAVAARTRRIRRRSPSPASLQSEAGCPDDWHPACATTHLAYDANDDVWQGTVRRLPAGRLRVQGASQRLLGRELRAPRRPEQRRQHPAQPRRRRERQVLLRPQEPLDRPTTAARPSPSAAGSFQSELGCSGDWDPGCLRSWLQDLDGDGIYTFETTALPAGSYAGKVAINESWDENYGAGGVLNGPNIAFTRPVRRHEGHLHLRRDDARPHDHGRRRPRRARRPWRAVALRPGAQGLPGHRPEHDVQGLVHGRRRDPERRLLPDRRQHQRRDPPVHRHGRLDLHRPPGSRHDVHGRRP